MVWEDRYTPPTGVLMASQFLELGDRLNEGRTAMSLPAVQWTGAVAAGALVRARTVKELRDGMK